MEKIEFLNNLVEGYVKEFGNKYTLIDMNKSVKVNTRTVFYRVDFTPDIRNEKISTDEWNGRDSDELCEYTRVDRVVSRNVGTKVEIKALDATEYRKELIARAKASYVMTLLDIESNFDQDNMDFDFSSTDGNLVKYGDMTETLKDGRSLTYIVIAYEGIRGLYVTGLTETYHLENRVDIDIASKTASDWGIEAMCQVQDYLEESNLLDNRYRLPFN